MKKTTVIVTAALCVLAFANAQAIDISYAACPEPSTIFAGALLLVPFGVSAVRALRRK
jgi:hypothetical protein